MESAARRSVISIVNENGKLTWRKEMKALCERKDGLVAQNKDKMLSTKEFMDSKMMKATFPPGDG